MSLPLTLADLPRVIDCARHKYNVGHVKVELPASAVVEYFAGTELPRHISLCNVVAADTVVYRQEWHCCGEYQCSSGNGRDSGRRRCSAVAMLTIKATGLTDDFCVEFVEPPTADHGASYVAPAADASPRTLYRTKVALTDAALKGLTYGALLQSMPKELWPVGWKANKTFKRRFENQCHCNASARAGALSTKRTIADISIAAPPALTPEPSATPLLASPGTPPSPIDVSPDVSMMPAALDIAAEKVAIEERTPEPAATAKKPRVFADIATAVLLVDLVFQ